MEAEGWIFLGSNERSDRQFAGFYYQRGEQYLHALVIDDTRRSLCRLSAADLQGGYITSSCFDGVSIYGSAPLGLDKVR